MIDENLPLINEKKAQPFVLKYQKGITIISVILTLIGLIISIVSITYHPRPLDPSFQYTNVSANKCGIKIEGIIQNYGSISNPMAKFSHMNGTAAESFEYQIKDIGDDQYFISLQINRVEPNHIYEFTTHYIHNGFEYKTGKKQIVTGTLIFNYVALNYSRNADSSIILNANVSFGNFTYSAHAQKKLEVMHYNFQMKEFGAENFLNITTGSWSAPKNWFAGKNILIDTRFTYIRLNPVKSYFYRILLEWPGTVPCKYISNAGVIEAIQH